MGEDSKERVSRICTVISVIMLVYTTSYGIFVEDVTLVELFFSRPLDYIVTFLPIIFGFIVNISLAIEEGFSGPKTVKYFIEPIIYIITVLIDLYIIKVFQMEIGTEINVDKKFWIGFLLLMIISIIEAAGFAYLESESTHEVFMGRTLILSWITLAAKNGCLYANDRIQFYEGKNPVLIWIGIAVAFTLIYMIWIAIYLLFAVFMGIAEQFK